MKKELSSQQADMMAYIYKRYAKDVKKYIAVSIHDDVEAEDMAHDVFERAMQIDVITTESANALLILMAKRKVIDYFRHKAIARSVEQEIAASFCDRDTRDADTQLTIAQVRQLEQRAVSLLTEKQARVYHCWRQGDKTLKEMAVELNINHRSLERYVYDSRRRVTDYIRKAI